MQRQVFNSGLGSVGNFASRIGAMLAITGLLLLITACDFRQLSPNDVTQNNLAEPSGPDGVPPTLTSVSIRESTKSAKPRGFVEAGKNARIDFSSSEALRTPVVTINGVEADVSGNVTGWSAVRLMTDADTLGEVTFMIVFQDISGEPGEPWTTPLTVVL